MPVVQSFYIGCVTLHHEIMFNYLFNYIKKYFAKGKT